MKAISGLNKQQLLLFYSVVHSFNTHLLSTCYVSGMVLAPGLKGEIRDIALGLSWGADKKPINNIVINCEKATKGDIPT